MTTRQRRLNGDRRQQGCKGDAGPQFLVRQGFVSRFG